MTRRRIMLMALAVAGLFAVAPCRPEAYSRIPHAKRGWWPDWLYVPGWGLGGEWTDAGDPDDEPDWWWTYPAAGAEG